jgi:beta-galactosidase
MIGVAFFVLAVVLSGGFVFCVQGARRALLRAIAVALRWWHSPLGYQHPWEDPAVVEIDRQPIHTPLKLATSEPLALERRASPWATDLSSETDWRFHYATCPGESPEGFHRSDFADGHWAPIPVPSHWQLQGYDIPIYNNLKYPWHGSKAPPFVPKFDNPTGHYRRSFTLPSEWRDPTRRVFIIFHGVDSGLECWLNGRYVGYSEDSRLPAEFDITDHLGTTTAHVLAVRVLRWTTGSYLEDQDHWRLSGIYRPVELQCRPTCGIRDYVVTTLIKAPYDDPADATVKVAVNLSQAGRLLPPGTTLRASLWHDGRTIAQAAGPIPDASRDVELSFAVARPRKWSAETPHLYTLLVTLVTEGASTPIQVEYCALGFRHIAIVNGQLTLNGRALLVAGVNRHEHDPLLGKVMTEESMLQDIELMKRSNFNAVRMCHYPNHQRFYELCDEHGLYVCDEANVENHGLFGMISLIQCDPVWRTAYITRVQRMVHRDRNHPSVILWSLGNESGYGPNMQAAKDWLSQADPSRPVQYEGGTRGHGIPFFMGDGQNLVSDIVCPMYFNALQIKRIAEDPLETRPIILCEYAHAMGNSVGNLDEYWALFRSPEHPQLQGGFIWDWVDQGLAAPCRSTVQTAGGYREADRDEVWHWGYGGDFGKGSGVDKQFCINGIVFPDRSPHPALAEVKYQQQPVRLTLAGDVRLVSCTPGKETSVEINVANSYSFLSTSHLDFNLTIIDGAKGHTLYSAKLPDVDVRSGGVGLLLVKLPAVQWPQKPSGLSDATARKSRQICGWLHLTVTLKNPTSWAPKGHVVAQERFTCAFSEPPSLQLRYLPPPLQPLEAPGSPKKTFEGQTVRIQASAYAAVLDLETGALARMSAADGTQLLLADQPFTHAFARAATDNDRGGAEFMVPWLVPLLRVVAPHALSYNDLWRVLELDRCVPLSVPTTRWISDMHFQAVTQHGPRAGRILFTVTTDFEFLTEGIRLGVRVVPGKLIHSLRTLPRVGLQLRLPGRLDQVVYLGRGPHECYPDRKAGAPMGIYGADVDDMHVPYIVPSENGGRSDVQWAAFLDAGRAGLLCEWTPPADPPASLEPPAGMQLNASRYTPGELEDAKHQYELPRHPDRVVVHLDARHMGVAGDSSWEPCLHPPYFVKPEREWRYGVKLIPVRPGQLEALPTSSPAAGSKENGTKRSVS